jgi:hypothetical protein
MQFTDGMALIVFKLMYHVYKESITRLNRRVFLC